MPSTVIGANATINETASTEFLEAETGRVSVVVTNLDTNDMWLARGTPAVIGQGIILRSNVPFVVTSDPNRTGTDNPIIGLSWNAISDTGAGAGNSIAYEVISQ